MKKLLVLVLLGLGGCGNALLPFTVQSVDSVCNPGDDPQLGAALVATQRALELIREDGRSRLEATELCVAALLQNCVISGCGENCAECPEYVVFAFDCADAMVNAVYGL